MMSHVRSSFITENDVSIFVHSVKIILNELCKYAGVKYEEIKEELEKESVFT